MDLLYRARKRAHIVKTFVSVSLYLRIQLLHPILLYYYRILLALYHDTLVIWYPKKRGQTVALCWDLTARSNLLLQPS